MMLLIRAAQQGRIIQSPSTLEETFMKWETPTAVDFRFGMEITMYIANR
jgi:coenzyme PQQ precursor peptide PqqA